MPGSQGNYNLYQAFASAFIDYTNASEEVTLPVGTLAVTLSASTRCWVTIGDPGKTPTAAAPSAEKVFRARTFAIDASDSIDLPVPQSTDASLVKVAVIRATADGVLDVIARKE